jgi:hypothetical protein
MSIDQRKIILLVSELAGFSHSQGQKRKLLEGASHMNAGTAAGLFLVGLHVLFERDNARNVARSSLSRLDHRHRYRLADD